MSNTIRDRPDITDDGLDVDLDDPINPDHDLNRGRVVWWLALPGLDGGRQWYDLVGSSHGTLGSSGTSWASGADGVSAAVAQNGTSTSAVDCGTPFTATTSKLTIAAWVYRAAAGDGCYFGWGDTNNARFNCSIQGTTTYNQVENGGSYYPNCPSPGAGWHRFLLSFDGTATSPAVYFDGVPQSLSYPGTAPTTYVPTGNFRVGSEVAGGRYSTGRFADVSIWSRALSAADARDDYDLSRRGYPGVLNRI